MKKTRIIALLLAIIGFIIVIYGTYQYNLLPTDKNDNKEIEVVIKEGMTTNNILKTLKEKQLIKNEFIFKVYLKLNNKGTLKASTYKLKKSMSSKEIADILIKGNNDADTITITFKEGMTVSTYASIIASKTKITEEDFLNKVNDQNYLKTLIDKYWFLTEDILNNDIYYALEGYLFPDTYQFLEKNLTEEIIIEKLLDEEAKKLEPYKSKLKNENIHNTLTLASIAELEGVKDKDRKLIISVFNNRLERGMNLGSDVTTYYAFNESMDKDLTKEMFNTYNPYNTRSSEMAGRLPVGPICNPSLSSIDAAINKFVSNYLYFVADKNRNVYFTTNRKEHEQKVAEIKEKGDWIW